MRFWDHCDRLSESCWFFSLQPQALGLKLCPLRKATPLLGCNIIHNRHNLERIDGGSVGLAMGCTEDKRRRPGVWGLRLSPSVPLLGASPVHHEKKGEIKQTKNRKANKKEER
jgi:hypothetical protein